MVYGALCSHANRFVQRFASLHVHDGTNAAIQQASAARLRLKGAQVLYGEVCAGEPGALSAGIPNPSVLVANRGVKSMGKKFVVLFSQPGRLYALSIPDVAASPKICGAWQERRRYKQKE